MSYSLPTWSIFSGFSKDFQSRDRSFTDTEEGLKPLLHKEAQSSCFLLFHESVVDK